MSTQLSPKKQNYLIFLAQSLAYFKYYYYLCSEFNVT